MRTSPTLALALALTLAGCGKSCSSASTPAGPAPLSVGAEPGALSVRLVYGVAAGTAGAVAQVFAERARTAGVAHYRIGGAVERVTVDLDGAGLEPFKAAIAKSGSLAIYRVADEFDPLKALSARADFAPPPGFSIGMEQAPLGPGKSDARAFVVSKGDDDRALFDLVKGVGLPPRTRFVAGDVMEPDPATGTPRRVGSRTVLVEDPPLILGDRVTDAIADEDEESGLGWHVVVTFDAAGTEAFRKATAQNLERRLAIAVDGRVRAMPVVKSEIPGGRAQISFGGGPSQKAEADDIADRLRHAPLPGPVTLLSEGKI